MSRIPSYTKPNQDPQSPFKRIRDVTAWIVIWVVSRKASHFSNDQQRCLTLLKQPAILSTGCAIEMIGTCSPVRLTLARHAVMWLCHALTRNWIMSQHHTFCLCPCFRWLTSMHNVSTWYIQHTLVHVSFAEWRRYGHRQVQHSWNTCQLNRLSLYVWEELHNLPSQGGTYPTVDTPTSTWKCMFWQS